MSDIVKITVMVNSVVAACVHADTAKPQLIECVARNEGDTLTVKVEPLEPEG